jgi:DNA-binding MarR family transcriptional regulator
MDYSLPYQMADIFTVLSTSRCIEMLKILNVNVFTVSQLANLLDLPIPTTSYYLKKLLYVDFIKTLTGLDDLRLKRIEITSRGKNALLLYKQGHSTIIAPFESE